MIPEINGTRQVCDGIFELSSTILCVGKQELFLVLEDRLKKAHIFSEFKFVNSEERKDDSQRVILLVYSEEIDEEEAYLMNILPTEIVISASTECGLIWGLTTLYHLLIEGNGTCPCQRIYDSPLYGYRGFHLDCSRHFFDVKTVCLMIELASRMKMNRMHWHISDDQGYRLESKQFPELNRTGSWRKEENGTVHGGYYTIEEVKGIVAFAKKRGIEIIPEIDMPGHVSAIIASYPDLSCSGEHMEVPYMPGIHKRILCGGKEAVLDFVFRLIDEVAALFPFPYFHIGGDEAPKDEWKKCPACQAKMKELGLNSEEELQTFFTIQVANHLKELGKKPICWNEALKTRKLPENIIVQYWDDEGENPNYCEHDVVNSDRKWIYSYTSYFYFDFTPALTPLRKAYRFVPTLHNGSIIEDDKLFGIECTLWSEQFSTEQELLNRAFPRMYAIGERGWCSIGNYEEFKLRCEQEIDILKKEGITVPSVEESDPCGEKQKQSVIEEWKPVIRNAKAMGIESMIPLICELVRGKLQDQIPLQELDKLVEKLQSEI